jgi:ABC-type sugar transport system permease subunit
LYQNYSLLYPPKHPKFIALEKLLLIYMIKQDFRSLDARLGFLLVLPAVILVIIVVILPIISGIQISFTSQRVVGSEYEFIGLNNYFDLLETNNLSPHLAGVRSGFWQMVFSKPWGPS